MDILTPVSSCEEIKEFIKEGIVEFYAGYVDEEWMRTFNYNGNLQLPLNRRTSIKSNFTLFSELLYAIELVKSVKGRLYITINASFYSENMYIYLYNYIKKIYSAGIRRVIVSDVGVMELLNEKFPNINIAVSCVSQVISSYMVDFFTKFNVERIVFPRHISVDEVCSIARKFPEIEFECFAFSEKCQHDDGNCRCMHNFGAICMENWNNIYEHTDGSCVSVCEKTKLLLNDSFYKNWIAPLTVNQVSIGNLGCSVCSLGELLKYDNIKSVKLSGRGRNIGFIKSQIIIVKKVIEMFQNNKSVNEVQEYIQNTLGHDHCIDYSFCVMRGVDSKYD